MLKIAICDDEAYFRLYEKRIIVNYMERNQLEYQIDLYQSGKGFLEQKENIQDYHILFLDIHMEEIDGLETAKQMRKFSTDIYLVFVTAFLAYAIEGYKVNAVRFILKEEMMEIALQECLDTILREINARNWKHCFAFLEGQLELKTKDLIYVESQLHKLMFHVKGRKNLIYTMYEKLDTIERLLEHQDFCRIHKSYLVNLQYATHVKRYQMELYNDTVLNIARGKFLEVKNHFLAYSLLL